jgi:hypothetical protein
MRRLSSAILLSLLAAVGTAYADAGGADNGVSLSCNDSKTCRAQSAVNANRTCAWTLHFSNGKGEKKQEGGSITLKGNDRAAFTYAQYGDPVVKAESIELKCTGPNPVP